MLNYTQGTKGNQDKEKPAFLPKKPDNMQSGMVGHQPLPKFSAGELPALQKDADVKLGQFSFPKPAKAVKASAKRMEVPSVRTSSNTVSTPKKQGYNMLNYTQENNVSDKGSIPRQVTSPYSSVNTNGGSRSTNGYSSYESPRPY